MKNPFKTFSRYLKGKLKEKKELQKAREEMKDRISKAVIDYAKLKENPSRYSKKLKNSIEVEFRELVELGYIEIQGTWNQN